MYGIHTYTYLTSRRPHDADTCRVIHALSQAAADGAEGALGVEELGGVVVSMCMCCMWWYERSTREGGWVRDPWVYVC